MKLVKPICFLDTETTGKNTEKDRVVEIAVIKIHLDGTREEKSYYINPQMPIPEAATLIHGITDEMVAEAPTFSRLAKGLDEFTAGCDIGGFRSNSYDVPLLHEEFKRCGMVWPRPGTSLLDAYYLYTHLNPRTLAIIYNLITGKELEGAHGALADTRASVEVFFSLVEQLDPDITPEEIDNKLQGDNKRVDMGRRLYRGPDGGVYWNFGTNKDKSIFFDMDYFNWVMSKDFPQETKDILNQLLLNS